MLDLIVPSFKLPPVNTFNLRRFDWTEDRIVQSVLSMLKAGEKYGINTKSIEIAKDINIDRKEIRRTYCRILNLILSNPSGKDLNVSYDIPWLVNNHFFIGGNKKICVYQLFDKPIIYRDKMVKIRTNIQTFTLIKKSKKRNVFNWYLSYFSKEIPLVYLYYGIRGNKENFIKELGLNADGTIPKIDNKTRPDYIDFLMDASDFIIDESINKEKLLSKFFNRKEDSEIISNIKLITEIDVFSSQYMSTDNIIDEYIHVLKNGTIDDLDYINKRVRFAEQVIYTFLASDFYDLIVSIKKNTKKSVFHVNSKIVIQNTNQSRIVQFDHSINPLSELAMISRLSLSGPGGFEKDNVPPYLRDINPTMFGLVCPSDTGDRENCGTSQYLIPTIELTENLTFKPQKNDVINSVSISHVPFLEHDDATRLQMSSSQQRHAIALEKFDVPTIQSGIEGMYTDQTSFVFRAKYDGQVVYKDRNIIVVKYTNGKCEAFNIGYKKLFLTVADLYKTYYKFGDKFKTGSIISESNFLTNGRLNIGKNLKTAIMVWYGYNYEDAIIISDKLVKDNTLTSLHYLDLTFEISPNKVLVNLNSDYNEYKPLPEIGDALKKGQPYAKVQTIFGSNDTHDVIFSDAQERYVTEDCVITGIKIFSNKWCHAFPQYSEFISSFVESKKAEKKKIIESLRQYLTQDELESFLESIEIDQTEKKRGSYKIKGDSIEGIRIEITAIYRRPITVGDKIGNRHGNKGVISRIVPHDLMPKFSNGETAEVIINPLGIPSRMNIGQLFELHLAQSVEDLKKNVRRMVKEGKNDADVKSYILEYIKLIDNTQDSNYTEQMFEYLTKIDIKGFIDNLDNFYVIQPPFESISTDQLDRAMTYTGTKKLYECYEPNFGDNVPTKIVDGFKTNIINQIAFGSMYFIKMNHIAKDKRAARSIGPYAPKTSQPLEGKGRKGGQRLGEMEVWAMIGHGATNNLSECLTTKSDSIKKRNRYLSQMIHNDDILLDDEDDPVSQSIRLFQKLLIVMGLDFTINENDTPNEH
jgi:DNA-directed RNA polymerase beta subunit